MSGAPNNLLVEDDDEEIEVIAGELAPGEPEVEEKAKPKADERLEADQRDDDDEDGDAIEARDDITSDQKREMRREQRRAQRDRRKQYIGRLEQALAETQQRLAAVEGRVQHQSVQGTEAQLRTAQEHYRRAQQMLADAIERGDGTAHAKALEYRDGARDAINQISYALEQGKRQPQRETQPQVDPTVSRNIEQFAKKFPWYDPNGRDLDSQFVLALDNAVAAEGLDPRSPDYWEELEDRMRERLPHKFKVEKKKGPPIASREQSSQGKPANAESFKISSQFKQALIEAGIWNNPEARDKAIRDHQRLRKEADGRR